MKAVLVTGGRTYDEPQLVYDALNGEAPHLVMHGDAIGADAYAAHWAKHTEVVEVRCPYIGSLGKGGGPARNTRMVSLAKTLAAGGWDVVVLAFPGGSGTADCVAKARVAGLPVKEVGR